jgi:PKD repeat protein
MRYIFFFLLTITFLQTSFAQSRLCGTDMMVHKSLSQHPELQVQRDELEAFTSQYTSSNERVLKVIPVVFHVIHNYGSENIAKTQIEDAIRILNEDYQLLNSDQDEVIPAFTSIVANVGFEFRLAQLDPDGNCTDGITRTVSTLTFNADDNVKDLVVWPRNKYLNVWVVDNISFGAGGYAYLPGSAQAGVDGIVVLHTQLGSIGTSGGSNFSARTLTHEVGHWFNLRHTWGTTNSPGEADNCSDDDGVTDTPNTIGVASQNCNLAQSTCGSPVDNVQNYMDYSSCAKMFTNGQKTRMLAAINSGTASRNNLWTDANLLATGVNDAAVPCSPIADFKASGLAACTNANITFQDQSYNASVDGTWNWNWSFPGGTPSSSNLQNPVVTYAAPGSYSATLSVNNSAGSNTKTKTNYILVSTSTPNLVSPVVEGFEIAAFPQNTSDATMNWRYEGPVSNAFSRTTAAFATGSASLRYNNLSVASDNSSSVISPVVDFSSVTSPATMSFKVAYARRSASTNDKLEVWISLDCGKTWTRRYSKVGATLATTTSLVSTTFVPTASQWRTETVSVAPLVGESHGMIKFTVIDSSGNNLYIDDINLVNAPIGVGISTPSLDEYVTQVFPNPGLGNAQLTFGLFKSEDVNVELLDITGRVIGNKDLGTKQAGEYTLGLNEISGSSFSSGIYFIRIQAGNTSTFRKWICN